MLGVAAAIFFMVSLFFPFWSARMSAPSYPEGDLFLHMYSYKYDGDIDEWNRVGALVGIRMPPPIPDQFFYLFPAAVTAASVLALLSAAIKRLLLVAASAPLALMGVVSAWGQYSLYLYGHNLDPERPLKFLEPFTPPIVGITTMGKIVTYHYLDIGSLLFVLGTLLLILYARRAGKLVFNRGKKQKELQELRYENVPQ